MKYYCLVLLLISGLYADAQKTQAVKNKNAAYKAELAGNTFDVYRVANKGRGIQLYWKDNKGKILKSLGNLKAYTAHKGKKLLFAANAGMYTTEFGPKGLYIENGKTLKKIDLKKGPSTNFYMQPNGVFYMTATGGHIATTADYTAVKEKTIYATQSGPMLVVNGEINNTFTRGSKNINIRSAVGIDDAGNVIFVISEGLVNFYDLATLFRDQLHCKNALFLDGGISRAYIPDLQRMDTDGEFGVIIGITE